MLEYEEVRLNRVTNVINFAEEKGLTEAGLFDPAKLDRPAKWIMFKDIKAGCKNWSELAGWWVYAKDLPPISELDIKTEDVLQHLRQKRNDLVAQCLRENETFQRVAHRNDHIASLMKKVSNDMELRRSSLRAISSYVRYVHDLSNDTALSPEVVVEEIVMLMKDLRTGIIPRVTCSAVRAEYGWWSYVFESYEDEEEEEKMR
jgi:hypothetical protein